ncbi:hypothetical protein FOG18_09900 [Legionella israelensis]|uniref:hypothetical protein n=1 Tax=Legionella israelensis TaxID=454 RepID=UPI00117CC59F|nr:hypothetical protein [Legionella israelensis]QDP72850.1 hypothetical protein FOG18_09900 [Legionella israelensis]
MGLLSKKAFYLGLSESGIKKLYFDGNSLERFEDTLKQISYGLYKTARLSEVIIDDSKFTEAQKSALHEYSPWQTQKPQLQSSNYDPRFSYSGSSVNMRAQPEPTHENEFKLV